MEPRRLLLALLLCSAHGAAQIPPPSLTTIYTFAGQPDGCRPEARLVLGQGGVIYGTTNIGGADNNGAIFSLLPPVSAGGPWTETILYSFKGGSDGALPKAPLAVGSGGVLYGITPMGGVSGYGTVFSLTPPAAGGSAWTENVLYSFTANGHGDVPVGLTVGDTGDLFVPTLVGGTANYGTINVLTPPTASGAPWGEHVMYSFTGSTTGVDPVANITIGKGGVLYGTTYGGGPADRGTVFSLTPPAIPGRPWTEAVLYAAPSTAGSIRSSVVIAGESNGLPVLYGVTWGPDTIYSLTAPATLGAPWTYAELYQFPDSSQNLQPGPILVGKNGTVYGTTGISGGNNGSVYVLKPPATSGGAWTQVVLYRFTGSTLPPYRLAIGSGGVLYGVAGGATNDCGSVFALSE